MVTPTQREALGETELVAFSTDPLAVRRDIPAEQVVRE